MTIPSIHPLNSRRIETVIQAKSVEQATKMGFIDTIIDKVFRHGAKKEAIKELYANIVNLKNEGDKADTADQMRNFLDIRNLVLPKYREACDVKLVEHPNGDHEYRLTIHGHDIFGPKTVSDKADIAALRHAENAIKVDNYLLKLQDYTSDACSLVARSNRFYISQGRVGDCYALATMIGILSNPSMHEKIESMAEVTDKGIRLTFPVDGYAANSWNRKMSLATITRSPGNMNFLRDKGYDLSWKADSPYFKDARGQSRKLMCLDISEEKLKGICNEKRSAQTNSLIVNILEHFVGNLVDLEESNDVDQAREQPRSRPRRDSLAIHSSQTRTANYDPAIANLLGYAVEGRKIAPPDREQLSRHLLNFARDHRLLSGDVVNGFVYVGMEYGKLDQFNQAHARHALVLNDIRIIDGEVTGVSLINPWDNLKEPEFYSIEDFEKRSPTFIPYLSVLPQQEHALPQIPNDEDERRVQRGAMILEP